MFEAIEDIISALGEAGIKIYPAEGAITAPAENDTRIVYTARLEPQIWAYPHIRGTLTMTLTVISYAPDREANLYEDVQGLIDTMNTIWGNRVRAYVEAIYADEATLRADVIASWPVVIKQKKEDI